LGLGPVTSTLPKIDKKDDSQVGVKKAMITCKTPNSIGQKLFNCKHLALNNICQKSKLKVHQGLASSVYFVTAMENLMNPGLNCFTYLGKK